MTDTIASSPLSGNVLFYAQPEPLSLDAHSTLGVDPVDKPYAFVAQTNLVPVMVTEFAPAALSYPVIFVGENKQPVAVMALRAGENLFVLDELALRKIVEAGRYAFLLVRDIPQARWVLWTVGDLLVAGRARHARSLDRGSGTHLKGKLVFDLSEGGFATHDLAEALDAITRTTRRLDAWWSDIAPWPTLPATG